MAQIPFFESKPSPAVNGYQVSPLVFSDRPLLGVTPEMYPNSDWNKARETYERSWAFWKGYSLDVKTREGKPLYPAKINIVRSAVIGHAASLLGQYNDRIISFSISDSLGMVDKQVAQDTTKVLNLLWNVNNGDTGFIEQALFQQIFGGYYWKVAWVPNRKRWAIRYFPIDPRSCFPVWDVDDYDRIVAMDMQYQMPVPTAKARFGLDLSSSMNVAEFVPVHERWTEEEYSISINGQIGKWPDGSDMAGPNPFEDPVMGQTIVPFVYVPRLRLREFLGETLINETLTSSQAEINNNVAHLFEGLADAMHPLPYVKNRPKGARELHMDRRKWLDIGTGQIGSNKEPEVGRLETAELTAPMVESVFGHLVQLSREYNNLPDVAYGRSDASVRSALTLAYMLKPLIDVGSHYRINAARGFKQMNYYALVIANAKTKLGSNINGVEKIVGMPVSEDMIEAVLLSHKTIFPPMLPDDRAELVNEVVQRLSAGPTLSIETAIRRLDGADDLVEELARIEEDKQKAMEEQQALAEQQIQMAQDGEKQGADMAMQQAEHANELAMKRDENKNQLNMKRNKAKPKDQTTRAQAAGGRAKNGGK